MFWNRRVDEIYKLKEEQAEKEGRRKKPEDPDDPKPGYENKPEKGDLFAMIVSAWLTIMPVAIGVLVFIVLLAWLLLGLW